MSEEEQKKLIHKKEKEEEEEEEETSSNTETESESESESEEEKTNKKMNELILSEDDDDEENDDEDIDEEKEDKKKKKKKTKKPTEKEEDKKKKEILCVECEFSPAILTCPQCGNDPLCKLCFVTLHRKGCRHEHTPIPIPTKEHQFESPFDSTTPSSSTSSTTDEQKQQTIIKKEGLFGYDDEDSSSSSSDDDDYRYGWFSWWGSNSSKSFHERKAERDKKRAEKEARRQQREAARGASHETLIDVTSKDSVFERAAYIPLRLSEGERKRLKLLIAALEASDYTDVVDAARFASGNPRARARRTTEQIRGICAVLLGLTLAVDPEAGRELEESKDYAKYARYYQEVFEIGRRHKIRNPDFMRTVYTKLMYIVQDSLLPEVEEMLGFNLAAPLRTVRSFLEERHAEAVLKDNLIEIATMEILSEGRSRQEVARDIKTKEKAIERIAARYKSKNISDEEIKTCLYSISDNNNFLRFNRDPIDTIITWLKEMFPAPSQQTSPSKKTIPENSENSEFPEKSEKVKEGKEGKEVKEGKEGKEGKKKTRKLEFVERKIEPELSLAIDGGKDGSRLTHTHERQYLYVMQSLTLWREIQHDMYRLWVLAEQDLLRTESPYVLKDTGQGLQRVQQAPQIYRAMQAILQATQARVGTWVGSSIIHIGDEQVPNALFFIDKYTQVPKILAPIVLTVKHVQNMPADGVWKIPHKYVVDTYGSLEEAKNVIMLDFFKRAFDGSGADNFFDAGSCIDGRLTSAWQWCASLNSKPFFHLFLFSGFIGFDGLWK